MLSSIPILCSSGSMFRVVVMEERPFLHCCSIFSSIHFPLLSFPIPAKEKHSTPWCCHYHVSLLGYGYVVVPHLRCHLTGHILSLVCFVQLNTLANCEWDFVCLWLNNEFPLDSFTLRQNFCSAQLILVAWIKSWTWALALHLLQSYTKIF